MVLHISQEEYVQCAMACSCKINWFGFPQNYVISWLTEQLSAANIFISNYPVYSHGLFTIKKGKIISIFKPKLTITGAEKHQIVRRDETFWLITSARKCRLISNKSF